MSQQSLRQVVHDSQATIVLYCRGREMNFDFRICLELTPYFLSFYHQGVEPDLCPSFTMAMKHGRPVHTHTEASLADGLTVPTVGVNALATAGNS